MKTIEELTEKCVQNNIAIDYIQLSNQLGFAIEESNELFIALSQKLLHMPKKHLETLAHELGHCECDSFITIDENTSFAKHLLCQIENRVKSYVIELLLPIDELKTALTYNSENLWALSDDIGLSYELIQDAVRYYNDKGLLASCQHS